jgi:succinate-acetate transporter protein
LFLLLAIHFYCDNNKNVQTAAGVDGVFCGLLAIYIALAEIINETYEKTILPLGAKKKNN